MKILITGGAGFIGTNLCEALQKNHTVVSIDNYSIGLKTNHIDGVKYIDADVLDIVNKVYLFHRQVPLQKEIQHC